jgi:hypothetical protein
MSSQFSEIIKSANDLAELGSSCLGCLFLLRQLRRKKQTNESPTAAGDGICPKIDFRPSIFGLEDD